MFIHVFDKKLKRRLIKAGFNLRYDSDVVSIFDYDDKIDFKFKKSDQQKYFLNNKIYI